MEGVHLSHPSTFTNWERLGNAGLSFQSTGYARTSITSRQLPHIAGSNEVPTWFLDLHLRLYLRMC